MLFCSNMISDKENCPCGSGLQYQKCCKNRKDKVTEISKSMGNEHRMNAYIINTLKRNKFSACMHPNKDECHKKIINAHSIQNNGVLSLLSKDSEVIIIEPGVGENGLKIDYRTKGKNQATTFTGFCAYHDREVFKPIETIEYSKTNEQHFLFAYRIFALEYYKKKVAFKSFQQTIRKIPSGLENEFFVSTYRNYQLAEKDMRAYETIFNEALLSENYSALCTYVVEFDYRVPIATAFGCSPLYDFDKKPLNVKSMIEFDEQRLKMNFVTVLPQRDKSYILYSWLKEDDEFFESLKSKLNTMSVREIKLLFNNLIPEYSENVVFAPLFWERLSEYQKQAFNTRLLGDFPRLEHNTMLAPDSLEYKNCLDVRPPYNLFRKLDFPDQSI